ncbi:putative O-acetyl-ADP-ribose deacetylase MACROD1 [Apostichopus japonicus]|uniref:Putative O-acetyl-ADP-ribose deacetylase MACROD1 n=1 Tax=Stichopus japonicus TaxID=307972 RepID=A0A2G8K1A9_STIJA|nr:putative O-acetyl-ADP-ribose deacetylase MACROD1 [Apostichopus japonicus]
MSQIEDSTDSDPETVPGLRRFHTYEPTRNTNVSVLRDRDIYLKKSLFEIAEEARWRISEVLTINDLATWPEYAEDLELTEAANSTSASNTNTDLSKKIVLWQGDITKLNVDAIVNAANNSLLGGGGVDGAIHRSAGSKLLSECRTLNGCVTGDAKITAAYLLPSQFVVHTVGPICRSLHSVVSQDSKMLLTSCYRTCLDKVLEHNELNKRSPDTASKDEERPGVSAEDDDSNASISKRLQRFEPPIRSIAFPCISTGIYGYPQEAAAEVALKTIREWIEEHPDELDAVIFCVFLDSDVRIYEKLLPVYFPLPEISFVTNFPLDTTKVSVLNVVTQPSPWLMGKFTCGEI